MDLNKYSSYMSLNPSDLYKAQRMVERVVRYHGEDHEAMVQELEEHLHGKTLEYAMELYEEAVSKTMEYMGVKITFNGKTYSAPTVGIYGVASKPQIKARVKEKVLERNQREEYEVTLADKKGNTQAYKNYKAGMKNKKTGQPLYKAGKGVEEALDPVGQEDADVDNDGKKNTKSDKYLKNRRKAISKAISAKEEFEIEALIDYFVTEQIAESESELDDIMVNIDEEHVEYFLEKAMELKGKKKGDVIINPKVDNIEEQEGGNDQTVLRNQKMMMAKKHQMDRQKMQLKKQGKLNVNAEEFEIDEATAMAKRGHDETAIRNKIAKSTGGGKSADRATALADKPTFGNDKAAKQRSDLARKQRGDFRKTTSSSPGLHGYGHKSDDPKVKAKQAARGAQRGALTPNEKKSLNREGFEMVNEVDYSGRPAAEDPASAKEKKYPTFAELKAKLAQAGDPSKGIPAGTQLPQTSLKKEEVEGLGKSEEDLQTFDEGLKQARKNVGADKCWDGYKAKGTKMKDGKEVPNCQKEENIEERTRYAKETGKDPQTGKPSEKGGTLGGDDRHSKVMRHMQKDLRKSGGLMSSRGKPIKPQGAKQEKGAKGYQGRTPVDRIKSQLAKKRAPKPDMGSRFD